MRNTQIYNYSLLACSIISKALCMWSFLDKNFLEKLFKIFQKNSNLNFRSLAPSLVNLGYFWYDFRILWGWVTLGTSFRRKFFFHNKHFEGELLSSASGRLIKFWRWIRNIEVSDKYMRLIIYMRSIYGRLNCLVLSV